MPADKIMKPLTGCDEASGYTSEYGWDSELDEPMMEALEDCIQDSIDLSTDVGKGHVGESTDGGGNPSCSVEETLKGINQEFLVPDGDEHVAEFQRKTMVVLKRLQDWARHVPEGWARLEMRDKEMRPGFWLILRKVDLQSLAKNFFRHMPRMTQKVLGKPGLLPVGLHGIPMVPPEHMHRLVYLDVPSSVGKLNIVMQPSTYGAACEVKNYGPNHTVFDDGIETKVYTGSSLDVRGGLERIRSHERSINHPNHEMSCHYSFARRADVVPFFRILGMWENPYIQGQKTAKDNHRWVPVLFEGLMMVYLGTYSREVSRGKLNQDIASIPSFTLVEKVREGLDLPDMAKCSLNLAWPLMQGVVGGFVRH